MAGYKHSDILKLKFDDMHRGKSYKTLYKTNIKCLVSDETKNKLRLRSIGALVLVYDKNLNLVKSSKTIKETGVFVGLSPSSVSKYIKVRYEIINIILNLYNVLSINHLIYNIFSCT